MLKEYEDQQKALLAAREAEEARRRQMEQQQQLEFERRQAEQAEQQRLAQEQLMQQQMQQQMIQAQQELAGRQVQGQAGGGLVTATVNGTGELQSVAIDPSVVDPTDVDTLQDLVVGAVRDAAGNAQKAAAELMGPLAGPLGDIGLPGF